MSESEVLGIIEEAAKEKVTKLDLAGKGIKKLPTEIGKLTNLTRLGLGTNELSSVPPELGQLMELESLYLEGNPLKSPPPEVVKEGTKAVLAYLRERLWRRGLFDVKGGAVCRAR